MSTTPPSWTTCRRRGSTTCCAGPPELAEPARHRRAGGQPPGGVPAAGGLSRREPMTIELWVDSVGAQPVQPSATTYRRRRPAARARTAAVPYDLAPASLRRLSDPSERRLAGRSARARREPLPALPRVRAASGEGHRYQLGALVRSGLLRSRQQREVLRLHPGGADRVLVDERSAWLWRRRGLGGRRGRTSSTRSRSTSGPSPYEVRTVVSSTSGTARSRTRRGDQGPDHRHRASPRPGTVLSSRPSP